MQGNGKSTATLAAFFDMEKAYDKVWRAGLLHKMIKMEIPMKFIQWTRNSLSHLKAVATWNGTDSTERLFKEGLPWVSAIPPPPLFILFINYITAELVHATAKIIFASDTNIS